MSKKITKEQAVSTFPKIKIEINGRKYDVPCRKMSTGSVGYSVNEKVEDWATPEGEMRVMVNCNLTFIKSKEWPSTEENTAA